MLAGKRKARRCQARELCRSPRNSGAAIAIAIAIAIVIAIIIVSIVIAIVIAIIMIAIVNSGAARGSVRGPALRGCRRVASVRKRGASRGNADETPAATLHQTPHRFIQTQHVSPTMPVYRQLICGCYI